MSLNSSLPDDKESRAPSTTPIKQDPSAKSSLEKSDEINPDDVHQRQYLTGAKLFAVMSAIVLLAFLFMLDTSIVSTAIPKITSEFHSLDDVGWYGTAFLLSNCALQPLTGKIYTYFNSKWVILSFFAIFELGSAICGAATSSAMLIVGRAIAGCGTAGLLNGGYGIIHASVTPEKHTFYLGLLTGLAQLGMVAGPLLGGVLTEYASWRWCFYINLPCGAVVFALLIFLNIPSFAVTRPSSALELAKKMDLFGFTLFAPAAIQFIFALQWGGVKYAWSSATIIGLFCGAFGTFVVFLVWERRVGDDAMIPFSIISKRIVWMSCLNIFFLFGSMMMSTYYLPIYFQAVRNASPTMSGVDLLATIISTMIAGVANGAIMGRVGYYLPSGILGGAISTIGSGLVSTFTPTTSTGKWIGYQILQGFGRGMSFQIPVTAVQNTSAPKQIATGNAMVIFSQTLGGSVALSLGQVVFSDRLRAGIRQYAPGVSPQTVVEAGASGVRDAVSKASLPGVILAYSKAFDNVLYLGTGLAAAQFLFAFGMGWVNIKKQNENSKAAQQVQANEKDVVEKV